MRWIIKFNWIKIYQYRFIGHNCYVDGVHQDTQIDPAKAAIWSLNDEESNRLIKKLLFLERQKSVYKKSYKSPGKIFSK